MTDDPNSQTQPSDPPQSEPPSQPSEADTTTLTNTGFKWGDDAPTDWQGQDAEYGLRKYNELQRAVNEYFAQQQQTQHVETPVPEQHKVDPDLIITEPEKWQAQLDQNIRQNTTATVNDAVGPLIQGAIENARELSMMDPKVKPYWEKFGDQIQQLGNNPQIDPRLKTTKAFWVNAAKAVASENLDTIVAERAAQVQAATVGVERGGGTFVSEPEMGALDKFKETDYGKQLAAKYSDRELVRHIESTGESIESFTAKAAGTHVQRDPNNPGVWRSDLARNV